MLEHRAAMRALGDTRLQYSHFVGLWTAASLHQRRFRCAFGVVSAAPHAGCHGCGQPMADTFSGFSAE